MRTLVSHRSTCRPATLALVSALAAAVAGCSPPHSTQVIGEEHGAALAPLSERERAIHLLNRATYGARADDVQAILSVGIDAWLDGQLHPASIDNSDAETLVAQLTLASRRAFFSGHGVFPPVPPSRQRLAESPPGTPAPQSPKPSLRDQAATRHAEANRLLDEATWLEILAAWLPPPLSTRLRGRAKPLHAQAQRELFEAMQLDTRANMEEALLREPPRSPESFAAARLARAVYSRRQLEEVMTDFWFNHFNVFLFKDDVALALDDYEQQAIRAHVFGRFEDMLVATARHPAMLRYLDASPARPPVDGTPTAISLLNENYARELLELHTLGVDGGYTQADIVSVARAFTGWAVVERRTPANAVGGSIVRGRPSHTFELVSEFRVRRHDRGPKIVLGRTLPAGRGIQDGVEVLRMLARHPSTARHLAYKLVRHFVADDPPPALVAAIAEVYRHTDGDLRAVTRALFTADAFYHPAYVRAKAKRPFEFVASALRVSGADIQRLEVAIQQLRLFGHLPYAEPAPTGYPATRDAWISGGALVARMHFAIALAGGDVYGIRIPSPDLPDEIDWRDDPDARNTVIGGALHRLLPAVPAADLEDALHEAAREWTGMDAASAAAAVTGVALASPAFQWH